MAFIGYSESGYEALRSEITYRKNLLLKVIGIFDVVQEDAKNAWKGADADAFVENFGKYIKELKSDISKIYDDMQRYFAKTYADWAEKQEKQNN